MLATNRLPALLPACGAGTAARPGRTPRGVYPAAHAEAAGSCTHGKRKDLPLPGNQGVLLDRTAHDHDIVCAPVGQARLRPWPALARTQRCVNGVLGVLQIALIEPEDVTGACTAPWRYQPGRPRQC